MSNMEMLAYAVTLIATGMYINYHATTKALLCFSITVWLTGVAVVVYGLLSGVLL